MKASKASRRMILSGLILGIVAVTGIVSPNPPEFVRYQATLTDDAGVPLDGVFDLTFTIHDADSGGTLVWSEGPRSIDVRGGRLDVLLGEVTPLPSKVFTAPDRWLEITVDGAVLAPRQRLASVPYSHAAGRIDQLTSNDLLDSAPPVGAVIPFFGAVSALPDSWKVCDGSVVSDPDSPLDGVTLPDLRSRFARGEPNTALDLVASGAGTGGTDDIGSHTHSTGSAGGHSHLVNSHSHTLSGSTDTVNTGSNACGVSYQTCDDNMGWGGGVHLRVDGGASTQEGQHRHLLNGLGSATATGGSTGAAGSHSHTVSSGGSVGGGNVPSYVALHFIIRIK